MSRFARVLLSFCSYFFLSLVAWQSYGSETAVISGGKRLSCTWKQATLNNATVHSCTLGATDPTRFQSLFINGLRLQRARYPNGTAILHTNGRLFTNTTVQFPLSLR